MTTTGTRQDLLKHVEEFLYFEARLADEGRCDDWEALLTEDMHYWVPAGLAVGNPADQLSYINDNRARVASRIRQMKSSRRHAQSPKSPMRRIISNIEILNDGLALGSTDGDEIVVGSNFVLYELAAQATRDLRIWPGRYTHRLRRVDGQFRIAAKWVELVNATEPQPNLTFII